MPNIYNALVVKGRDTLGQEINVTCEVQQLLESSDNPISLFSKRFFFSLTSKSPRDLSPSLAADDPIQNQRSPVIVFPLPRRPSPSSQLRSIITRIRFLSFNSDTKLPIIPNKRYEFQTLFSSFCLNSISKD
jgi:hypothetical protein